MRIWSVLFGVVALLCAATFAYAPFDAEWWLPAGPEVGKHFLHSASTLGKQIDALFVIILWVTGVVFIGTQVVLVWATWKYADRPGRITVYFHGSQRLELIWTIIPAVFLVFLALYQMQTWADIKFQTKRPNTAPIAEVTGRQFEWLIRYPGPDGKFRTADDLHTKNDFHFVKDQPTLIQLRSNDVIHSFFLPALRVKQDAVPGLTIPVWFDTDQAGQYELVCAELCGWGHYKMRSNVTVHATQAEFDAWARAASQEQSRDQVAESTPKVAASEGR